MRNPRYLAHHRAPRHRQNDVVVHDVFVEQEHSFSFQDPELVKRSEPLYAFPFLFIAKGSAPALGIARHAIDAVIESAAGKRARRYTVGERIEAPKMLRDDVYLPFLSG